jgi:branched-chain amino acid transport system ATP-binding protein
MHLLEIEAIDVFYGPIQALRGVSMHVAAGEMVALVGANGAGKTTTLRTISGLLVPRRGSISFEGRPVEGLPAQEVVRRGITHLPEGRELFPSLSVLENLRMGYWPKRSDKAGLRPAVDRAMDLFPRLRERSGQAAGTLSGGEQQMLGVARALMSSPRMLVVDELSLGLAPMVVSQLFDVLRQINRDGTAVLLVEQFVHMALQNTHRAYVLAKGSVVANGPSDDMLRDPALVESYLGGHAEHPGEGSDETRARQNGGARGG